MPEPQPPEPTEPQQEAPQEPQTAAAQSAAQPQPEAPPAAPKPESQSDDPEVTAELAIRRAQVEELRGRLAAEATQAAEAQRQLGSQLRRAEIARAASAGLEAAHRAAVQEAADLRLREQAAAAERDAALRGAELLKSEVSEVRQQLQQQGQHVACQLELEGAAVRYQGRIKQYLLLIGRHVQQLEQEQGALRDSVTRVAGVGQRLERASAHFACRERLWLAERARLEQCLVQLGAEVERLKIQSEKASSEQSTLYEALLGQLRLNLNVEIEKNSALSKALEQARAGEAGGERRLQELAHRLHGEQQRADRLQEESAGLGDRLKHSQRQLEIMERKHKFELEYATQKPLCFSCETQTDAPEEEEVPETQPEPEPEPEPEPGPEPGRVARRARPSPMYALPDDGWAQQQQQPQRQADGAWYSRRTPGTTVAGPEPEARGSCGSAYPAHSAPGFSRPGHSQDPGVPSPVPPRSGFSRPGPADPDSRAPVGTGYRPPGPGPTGMEPRADAETRPWRGADCSLPGPGPTALAPGPSDPVLPLQSPSIPRPGLRCPILTDPGPTGSQPPACESLRPSLGPQTGAEALPGGAAPGRRLLRYFLQGYAVCAGSLHRGTQGTTAAKIGFTKKTYSTLPRRSDEESNCISARNSKDETAIDKNDTVQQIKEKLSFRTEDTNTEPALDQKLSEGGEIEVSCAEVTSTVPNDKRDSIPPIKKAKASHNGGEARSTEDDSAKCANSEKNPEFNKSDRTDKPDNDAPRNLLDDDCVVVLDCIPTELLNKLK